MPIKQEDRMLGEVLRKWRIVNERDLRGVAGEIGISAATLLRIEQGKDCDAKTFMILLEWLMGRRHAA